MTSISYEGVKQMKQLEEEINASIRDYREELKKVWEKESLEELLEKKQEKFAELRRRIPCLSVDNLEETVTLYRSFLERKAEGRLLMTEVEAKYSSVWDIAQEKVVKLYGTKNRQYRPESKEVFLKTLFTGEYLYQKFCEENAAAGVWKRQVESRSAAKKRLRLIFQIFWMLYTKFSHQFVKICRSILWLGI